MADNPRGSSKIKPLLDNTPNASFSKPEDILAQNMVLNLDYRIK